MAPRNCAVIQRVIAVIKRFAVKKVKVERRRKEIAVIQMMTAVSRRNVVRKRNVEPRMPAVILLMTAVIKRNAVWRVNVEMKPRKLKRKWQLFKHLIHPRINLK